MNIQLSGLAAMVLGALCFAFATGQPVNGQDKEKNPIAALFDGIPEELRSNIKSNAVRCDRVNDWLEEYVNGKGKLVETQLNVNRVFTTRAKDKTYQVNLDVEHISVRVLGDEWRASFAQKSSEFGRVYSFTFTGVSTSDAEKLVGMKQAVIKGKVTMVKLSRNNSSGFGKGGFASSNSTFQVILEDVLVDGKKWAPYVERAVFEEGIVPFPGAGKSKNKKGSGQKNQDP